RSSIVRESLPAPFARDCICNGGTRVMIRSARWPLLIICVAGGVAVGRWAGEPVAQGQLAPTSAIPRELTSYRDVVKQVLPAVGRQKRTRGQGAPPRGEPAARPPRGRTAPRPPRRLPPLLRRDAAPPGGAAARSQRRVRVGFSRGRVRNCPDE